MLWLGRFSSIAWASCVTAASENQRYRASGLNLAVADIVAWNTVYLGRAVASLSVPGEEIGTDVLAHLSPLGWEHINLTEDYVWHSLQQTCHSRALSTLTRTHTRKLLVLAC